MSNYALNSELISHSQQIAPEIKDNVGLDGKFQTYYKSRRFFPATMNLHKFYHCIKFYN